MNQPSPLRGIYFKKITGTTFQLVHLTGKRHHWILCILIGVALCKPNIFEETFISWQSLIILVITLWYTSWKSILKLLTSSRSLNPSLKSRVVNILKYWDVIKEENMNTNDTQHIVKTLESRDNSLLGTHHIKKV